LVFLSGAQRRPESKLRRHRRPGRRPGRSKPALNEGRSRNSGDTGTWRTRSCPIPSTLNKGRSRNSGDTIHQPGRDRPDQTRSTKAGVETPATLSSQRSAPSSHSAAQQRPESKLRRHRPISSQECCTPKFAQQRPESKLRRHTCCGGTRSRRRTTLNKGRSRNSGDTPTPMAVIAAIRYAQQRPESKLRRHLAVEPRRHRP